MIDFKKIKYLVKSKSWSFARNLHEKNHHMSSILWNKRNIYYRSSSSDMTLIYEILLKSKFKREYYFPEEIKPKVIFDIGGNIGITSIYLASIFPDSLIYSFEPLKENFEILKKNTSQYNNIEVFNIGLGSKNGRFEVYLSDDNENHGGVSFYSEVEGNLSESYIECEVRNINDIIKEIGVTSIDLIKIDTEGGEYDILTALNTNLLKHVSWISGELHGNRDFELLAYLESLGFSISLKKNIDNRLFMFNAGNRRIVNNLSKKEIKILF